MVGGHCVLFSWIQRSGNKIIRPVFEEAVLRFRYYAAIKHERLRKMATYVLRDDRAVLRGLEMR